MFGVEFVREDGTPNRTAAEYVMEKTRVKGVLCSADGKYVSH